jgi:signal transduction histidine kinase
MSNVPTVPDETIFGGMSSYVWHLVLATVISFFVISAVFSYRSVNIIAANNRSINNNLQTINLIKDLKTELLAAESSQRGFLLTSDENYLEPYHKTLHVIDGLLNKLNDASDEIPAQSKRYNELYSLVLAKIDEMQMLVGLTGEDRYREAINKIRTDEGIKLMESITDLIGEMEIDEAQRLKENKSHALNNRQFIVISLLLTNSIGLVLSLGIFFILYRNSSKVADLYRALERANSELEAKVDARTQALMQYSEELQRSNKELEAFAFVASHDLQEPLRKIRAFGDRLQQKYMNELGERGADYVKRMQAASERMSILIDDLLSFSRVTTKQKPFVQVDLNQMMARVLDDLDYAVEDSGAKLYIESLPTIDADASQMGQVFMNLMTNSLKFRQTDKPPVIKVTCDQQCESPLVEDNREWCCIKFSDQGIGFDPHYADRVFNLFQRLHGRDEYSGTGIGLALCRKIIERHGGSIEAESELGKGATFIIRLPMKQLVIEPLDVNRLSSEAVTLNK